jgi:hypothetical protein
MATTTRPVLTLAPSDNSRVLGSVLSSELVWANLKADLKAALADRLVVVPSSTRTGK